MCIHMCMCVYIDIGNNMCIYIYRERERYKSQKNNLSSDPPWGGTVRRRPRPISALRFWILIVYNIVK